MRVGRASPANRSSKTCVPAKGNAGGQCPPYQSRRPPNPLMLKGSYENLSECLNIADGVRTGEPTSSPSSPVVDVGSSLPRMPDAFCGRPSQMSGPRFRFRFLRWCCCPITCTVSGRYLGAMTTTHRDGGASRKPSLRRGWRQDTMRASQRHPAIAGTSAASGRPASGNTPSVVSEILSCT
mgnify:CR=1 FL=1